MLKWLSAALCALWAGQALAELSVPVGYLKVERTAGPTLSNLDPVPDDLGLAGAQLGLAENTTTGRFLGQEFSLGAVTVAIDGDPTAVAQSALETTRFLLIDAPAETLLAIADLPAAQGAVLFNVGAPETDLRDGSCRANLLHTLPSRAMLADALSQFLVGKKWTETALVAGPRAGDQALAAALEASLSKFGLKPGPRADWSFDADMRRNASQEVPLFTQGLGDHDVLLLADETNDFARYVLFNTWLPRPVAGSAGLRPVAWSRVVEQWGAAQLQGRFTEASGRDMLPEDYAAWAAMRSIGEAVTRTGSDSTEALFAYLLSDAFELAGFKGRPLSYRAWNGQLRQPVPLVHSGAVVASAPLEGFLHQHNELDTLGLDAPDSACRAFQE